MFHVKECFILQSNSSELLVDRTSEVIPQKFAVLHLVINSGCHYEGTSLVLFKLDFRVGNFKDPGS